MSQPPVPLATVYAVFANAGEADRVGRAMVEARLAACVNILAPCRSIYRWQGGIEEASEVPALFKTRADIADSLVAAIVAAHSYDVPAVTVWPIASAAPAYAGWIAAETGEVS
jgi:periplasmic divalent cation tolerance protein